MRKTSCRRGDASGGSSRVKPASTWGRGSTTKFAIVLTEGCATVAWWEGGALGVNAAGGDGVLFTHPGDPSPSFNLGRSFLPRRALESQLADLWL